MSPIAVARNKMKYSVSEKLCRFGNSFNSITKIENMLYVRILESDQQTVRDVFSDPNETSVLTYGGNEYTGYTMLRSVFDEGDALKVGLDYAINNNT